MYICIPVGGNVVHISCGMAGLVSANVVGHRTGYGAERFEAHNILLTFIGACMLWVGWFGFNAGSAVAANSVSGIAMLNTQISASMAGLSWMFTEWFLRKQPSVLGMVTGGIVGLVAVTPAAAFVNTNGAFWIGLISGPICYFGCQLKSHLGFDDALDTFGVHAVGGAVGGIAVSYIYDV